MKRRTQRSRGRRGTPCAIAGTVALGASLALASPVLADTTVEILDRSFDTAANMFAYTEFELSGEPLAEVLGLDLDVLDPNRVDEPTAFDYAAGIESYEYSEEAMYALDYQSRMGLHLANGPVNTARGGKRESLGERVIELAGAVRFPVDELPLNLYPVSVPYASGDPEFAGPVNVKAIGSDEIEILDARGETRELDVAVPAYLRDFETLRWKGASDPVLTPGALGGALLKEALWSQDFLGGMHTVAEDLEVEARSSDMDADGTHALGVSSVDGMNGVLLTEIVWDKLWTLQDQLAYDGKELGVNFGPGYEAAAAPVWFPHRMRVKPAQKNGSNAAVGYEVIDASSQLRDLWLLLWSSSEFYAFADGRSSHPSQNPAFRAVFDGAPFPSAPAANRDADAENDERATDPFSLASNVGHLVFENLAALHFDSELGSFVDRWEESRGKQVTTYDAAYTIVALAVFQRARDALPVGYASSEAGAAGLETAVGKRALELIRAQANFIRKTLVGPKGLVADRYDIASKQASGASLGSQFAAIRGLAAAFVATGEPDFKQSARAIFEAVEQRQFDEALGTYADVPGQPTEHTPWTAGAISGGLRALLLNLRNEEGESSPVLSPAHLTQRYVGWFRGVVNGPRDGDGMQLAEWIGDSGENVIAVSKGPRQTAPISEAAPPSEAADANPVSAAASRSSAVQGERDDGDRDGVPQVTAAGGAHGAAMVLAGRVRVSALPKRAASGE